MKSLFKNLFVAEISLSNIATSASRARQFASLAVVLVLVGCATPYHSTGITGGYSDTQLAPDVFRVVFRGNGYTSAERAQDFALLRASELAVQNGFTCFAVIDEQESTSISSYTTPGHADTTAYGTGYSSGGIYLNPYGGSYSGTSSAYVTASTSYTPPQTHVFYRPRTGLLFRAFKNKPESIFTFDAVFLQQSLMRKYHIKEPLTAPMVVKNFDSAENPSGTDTTPTSIASATNADVVANFEQYKAKAEKGDTVAQFILGYCYDTGKGVARDYVEAVKWYRKAADTGDADSQLNLAVLYHEGHGVPKNDVEAVKWTSRAAEQGNGEAQFNLGMAYCCGDGVPKDYVEGYKWLNLASAQSIERAKACLSKIEQQMSPEQVAEAQQLSRGFAPREETPRN